MAFRRVAREGAIPAGRGLRVEIAGIQVGLFRVGDEIFAMENVCPHAGLPLSAGTLEGCIVTCNAHGWSFDVRTGFAPGDDDGFPIPCFAVRVENGDVEVDIEQSTNLGRTARRRP